MRQDTHTNTFKFFDNIKGKKMVNWYFINANKQSSSAYDAT